MITLVYAIHHLPNLSDEDFQDYWRDIHGPLVASFSTVLNIRRYVQCHPILDYPVNVDIRKANGGILPVDGTEFYYWDSHDSLAKTLSTAEGKRALASIIDDERKFVEFPNSTMFVGIEQIQVKGTEFSGSSPENVLAIEKSHLIRGTGVLYRRPDKFKSRQEFLQYYRSNHGPLVRSFEEVLRARRYAQFQNVDDPLTEELRAARGKMMDIPDASTNAWIHRLHSDQANATPEGRQAWTVIRDDEKEAFDQTRPTIKMIWTKEHCFVDRTGAFNENERKLLRDMELLARK